MPLSKPQNWVFQTGLIAEEGLDLWRDCVLALPFWDYGQRIVEDLSGNGLHANFQAGLSPFNDWAVGQYGSHLEFDLGTNADLAIPVPPAAWLDGTSKLSVEVIFRTNDNTGGVIQGVIGKYTTTAGRRSWRIYLDGDEIALQVSNDGSGNEIQLTTNANLSTGTWYHLVITFSSGVFKAYLNNVLLTTDGDFGTHTSIFAGTLQDIQIGRRSDSNRFNGAIAGVRVWKERVLDANVVRRLYEDPWEMYTPVFPMPFLPTMAVLHSGGAAAGAWVKWADVLKGGQETLITGLNNGTSYDVQLFSVDTPAGNKSAGTTPVAGTPAAGQGTGIDTKVPVQSHSRPRRVQLARSRGRR